MTTPLWAVSLIECMVMCKAGSLSQRELDAITRLLARQPLEKNDAHFIEHVITTNPMMKLDSLDIDEFREWMRN